MMSICRPHWSTHPNFVVPSDGTADRRAVYKTALLIFRCIL